jgi:hypothetical protein
MAIAALTRSALEPVPVSDRARLRGVERPLGEADHPAGHRHGDLLGGKVADQRVCHFASVFQAKYAVAWPVMSQANGRVGVEAEAAGVVHQHFTV